MTSKSLEDLWSDPANWNADGSYKCADDPRVFVPKLAGGGWTLNMLHPGARWVMVSLVAGVLLLVIGIGVYAARRQVRS